MYQNFHTALYKPKVYSTYWKMLPRPNEKKEKKTANFIWGKNIKTEKRVKERGRKQAGKIYATNIFHCIMWRREMSAVDQRWAPI